MWARTNMKLSVNASFSLATASLSAHNSKHLYDDIEGVLRDIGRPTGHGISIILSEHALRQTMALAAMTYPFAGAWNCVKAGEQRFMEAVFLSCDFVGNRETIDDSEDDGVDVEPVGTTMFFVPTDANPFHFAENWVAVLTNIETDGVD